MNLEMIERIKQLQTPKGGWTKKDLASLGVPWPPTKGWRRRLEESDPEPPDEESDLQWKLRLEEEIGDHECDLTRAGD